MEDRPAWNGSDAVWQAHRANAVRCIAALRCGGPRLSAAIIGGSAAALGLLVTSGLIAGAAGPERLRRALIPFAYSTQLPPARLQAWIVPPRSSGVPTVFLQAATTLPPAVPVGSHLSVSAIGRERPPSLVFAGTRHNFHHLDRTSFQADVDLQNSGTLEVWHAGEKLAQWRLQVTAGRPPTVQWTGLPTIIGGQAIAPWRASDAFGIASVNAVLMLRHVPAARPLIVGLPIERSPRVAHGEDLPDLTASPWAGLPVALHIVATDLGGERGESSSIELTLPEPTFLNPIARAIQTIRRNLAMQLNASAAAAALDQLSANCLSIVSSGQWLNLRSVAALLATQPKRLDQADTRLWQLARAIEDGRMTDAKSRLAKARTDLRDALAAPTSRAQQSRLETPINALESAVRSYLEALALQGAQNAQGEPERPDQHALDAGKAYQMTADLAAAAKSGRMADADAQLRRLNALLDSLKSMQVRQNGREAGQLGDRPLERLSADQDRLRNQIINKSSSESHSGPTTKDSAAQNALRQRLGDIADRLGDSGRPVPEALARADNAMRQAVQALLTGNEAAAREFQQQASAGLRAGMQKMAVPQVSNNAPPEAERRSVEQDPFGRPLANGQETDPDHDPSSLQLGGDPAEGRNIRDELRRRSADHSRGEQELEYFNRLLGTD